MNEGVGYFYLVYSHNRRLEIRFPSRSSTPFIAVRGSRAAKLYEVLRTVLEAYKMATVAKQGSDLVLELPSAVGLSVAIYLLASYNTPYYERYIFVVEQMCKGEMPIAKHLTRFIELAADLSTHIDIMAKKQIVSRRAAQLTAKALRVILNGLRPT
jgi:hypothetical protein